jgi:hypothetical protein
VHCVHGTGFSAGLVFAAFEAVFDAAFSGLAQRSTRCVAMLEVVSGSIRHGIPCFTRLILHDFEAFNRCESVRKHANNPGFA